MSISTLQKLREECQTFNQLTLILSDYHLKRLWHALMAFYRTLDLSDPQTKLAADRLVGDSHRKMMKQGYNG